MASTSTLKRELKKAQQSYLVIQKKYNREQHLKQITTLSQKLSESDEVLDLIINKDLGADDVSVIADTIICNLENIYLAAEDIIIANRQLRAKKNEARRVKAQQQHNASDFTTNSSAVATEDVCDEETSEQIRQY